MEIDEEEVIRLRDLPKNWTSSISKEKDGKTEDITDHNDFDAYDGVGKDDDDDEIESDSYHSKNLPEPQKISEWHEKFNFLFAVLKPEFEEEISKKPEEAEFFRKILTVDLLRKHFPKHLADKNDGKDGRFVAERKFFDDDSAVILNLKKVFREADIFDSKILDRLFSGENYNLPELQKIAERAGFSKSATTKKLTRFYDRVIKIFKDKIGDKNEEKPPQRYSRGARIRGEILKEVKKSQIFSSKTVNSSSFSH